MIFFCVATEPMNPKLSTVTKHPKLLIAYSPCLVLIYKSPKVEVEDVKMRGCEKCTESGDVTPFTKHTYESTTSQNNQFFLKRTLWKIFCARVIGLHFFKD